GHLEIVQWLRWNRQEGCMQNAVDEGSRNGNLTEEAIDRALMGAHLAVVQCLHNHHKPCSKNAID
ncbi:hypothetical protein BDZ88DRAFT_395830, partial [Geranomyces variabilis]